MERFLVLGEFTPFQIIGAIIVLALLIGAFTHGGKGNGGNSNSNSNNNNSTPTA